MWTEDARRNVVLEIGDVVFKGAQFHSNQEEVQKIAKLCEILNLGKTEGSFINENYVPEIICGRDNAVIGRAEIVRIQKKETEEVEKEGYLQRIVFNKQLSRLLE